MLAYQATPPCPLLQWRTFPPLSLGSYHHSGDNITRRVTTEQKYKTRNIQDAVTVRTTLCLSKQTHFPTVQDSILNTISNRGYIKIISVSNFTKTHVTMSETEIKLFQPLKKLQNYFGNTEHVGKCSQAAISLWNNCKIISHKFPRAETKLFQTDVDKGWNNFEIILFHV